MTERSAELADTIVAGIENGIPLRQLARLHGFSKSWFYVWKNEDEELAGRIARARDIGFDEIAEETLEIADDASNDWMERETEAGNIIPSVNHEHVQRSKLRIDTRLKLLAKWYPQKYGEKTLIGSDPDNPLPPGFNVVLKGKAASDTPDD
ncbi:MAG: terminase small subunit protein [Pseudomonadota bacterium]